MSKSVEPGVPGDLVECILDRLEQESSRPLEEIVGLGDARTRLRGMLAKDSELACRLFAIVLGQRLALDEAQAQLSALEAKYNAAAVAGATEPSARPRWLEWLIGPPSPSSGANEAASVPPPSHRLAFEEPSDLHLAGAPQGGRPSGEGSRGAAVAPLLTLAYAVAGSSLIAYLYNIGSPAAYAAEIDGEAPSDTDDLTKQADNDGDDGVDDSGGEDGGGAD